ncbi:MAG: fibronectin type III domain-containing protein, partial [Actinobacteria bacterium]|nr:fibronectin type III domain-containing protein [Actinomycetota bacterium]
MVVNYSNVGTPIFKFLMLDAGDATAAEYPTSNSELTVGPTVFGHNGGKDTISMAAIAYNSSTTPESYSSRGPVTHYFEPDNGSTPAAPLAEPDVLARPDVTATDGDCTTFFGGSTSLGSSCPYRFYGTSAASPNAAGVAALLHQAQPAITAAEVRAALSSTATNLSGGTMSSVGAGLIDANAAVAAVLGPVVPGTPTIYTVSPGDQAVEVTWLAPGSDGGSPITGYTATASPGGQTCVPSPATAVICTVTGLTNGQSYTFTVHATNAVGDGPESASSSAVTPAVVPDAPTDVTATAGVESASVAWTAPGSDGGSAITGYTTTASPGGQTCSPNVPTETTCTVTGLTAGLTYTFTAVASNATGAGAASLPSNEVVPTASPPPTP